MASVMGAVQQAALVETYVDSGGVTRVLDSFQLTPSFGWVYYQTLDTGFPSTRSSVQDNPQSDGTFDQTQYTGARGVSISGTIKNRAFAGLDTSGWDPDVAWNSASWMVRYLASWASPARRFRLYIQDESGVSRYVNVRGDSFQSPIDRTADLYRSFQLQLVNPDGRWYSFNTNDDATPDGKNILTIRQSTLDVPGRVYPEPAPYLRDYPLLAGATSFIYRGSVSTTFQAHVYTLSSSMTVPRITITGPDGVTQSVGISGVTIPANYVITFDSELKTISMNPVTDSSTVTSLDQYKTAPLQWPRLKPGASVSSLPGRNQVTFSCATGDTNAYVTIVYNDADLL